MSAVHLITEHKGVPCAIADLSLAAWGRKELKIAESEMPALMAIRDQPLAAEAMGVELARYKTITFGVELETTIPALSGVVVGR